ncbi:alpha-ketoglutarate decarboxylase [Bacillus sp. SG-1]|nr:alpha-ketoglutarate decarboxylase [Bacillus sp. SG-1]
MQAHALQFMSKIQSFMFDHLVSRDKKINKGELQNTEEELLNMKRKITGE